MSQMDQEHKTVPPDGKPYRNQPRWRRDFPIDTAQDYYVARRDFTKFMALTSLAFFFGQVWIWLHKIFRKQEVTTSMQIATTAEVASLQVGQTKLFNYPAAHEGCVLVRTGNGPGDWTAFSQKCTHLSCAVVPDPAKRTLDCPCHEGQFDMMTGRPIAGPPRRPLPIIKLDVRPDGIYATGTDTRIV